MTPEKNERHENDDASGLNEIGNRVRYIQRKVSEISEQVEDNYKILRDILDATSRENGANGYDFFEDDTDYL